jgi:hypothetical protein
MKSKLKRLLGLKSTTSSSKSAYSDFVLIKLPTGTNCGNLTTNFGCCKLAFDFPKPVDIEMLTLRYQVVKRSYLIEEHEKRCPSCSLLYLGIAELLGHDWVERYEELFCYDNHIPVFASPEFFKGEIHIRLWPKRNVGPSIGLDLFVEDGMFSMI